MPCPSRPRAARRALLPMPALAAALLAAALGAAGLAAPPTASAAPRFRPAADDVFYMYMPIAWRDSDGDTYRFGDFGGMTASIPYLKSLGVTAVWMTPLFPSAAYHGYQHGRADSLDARFGTEAQFWTFVQAAHAESIKVFLDFVAYGISQNTVWFQDSYGNPASVYDDWLAYTNGSNTGYLGCCPYPTWDGSTVGFIHWDLRNPQVTAMVTDWAKHWLDPNGDLDPSDGVDGFRLDHVSWYHPDESPFGYDIAWWMGWNQALRALYPDVFTFAEQADWGSYGSELLGAFDAAFTKPFEFAARDGLANADAARVAGSMSATLGTLPDDALYLATIGNHDVERIATRLGGDAGKLRSAAAVLMLQPLPPVIYFGDEIGMRGGKNLTYTGDAVDIPFREPFKWNAVAGPPMSNYFALNAAAYAGRVSRNNDGRSVAEQDGVPGSLLEHYRSLAALRHAHPALRRGDYREAGASDPAVWSFLKFAEGETLLVAINLGGGTTTPGLDLSAFVLPPGGSSPVTDVETLAGLPAITAANLGAYPVALAANGHRVLRVSLAPRDLRDEYADANLVLTQDSPGLVQDHVFELDQMYVRFDPDGLALGITGNLIEGGHGLAVFFDAADGGQSTLQTATFPQPPSGLPQLSGMVLDAGFQPEKVLFVNNSGGKTYVDYYTLATGGGGSKRYVGSVSVGGSGPLTGGSNPNGMRVTYSPWNRAGISLGTAAGAATATEGFRILVPWADLGLAGPGAPLKLMSMLVVVDGYVFNQFLPGLQGRDTPLGYAPFDLNTVPGTQYVSVSNTTGIEADPVPPARIALLGAAPNPSRGPVRVRFSLGGTGPATLELLDLAGRRVARRDVGGLGAGTHAVELGAGRALPPGLYFVRLAQGGETREVRVAVLK